MNITASYRAYSHQLTHQSLISQVSWSLMNDGDVYVLDAREVVYVWVGAYSNNAEKLQGAKVNQTDMEEHLRYSDANSKNRIL